MTIWERVKSALSGLSVPMAANVYVPASETERPDTYMVYMLVAAPTLQHADDKEILREHSVQVSIFSRGGLVSLPDVESAMKAAGFMYETQRELPFNPETGHYGLAMDFNFVEDKE